MTSESNHSGTSRANQLRQKRQQNSQAQKNNLRQQPARPLSHLRTNPAPTQPKVSRPIPQARANTTVRRTTSYAIPNSYATRTAPARKLHYARGANGVEVRMPALPSIQFNWQTASAFLAFSLLILVVLLTSLDTFHVSAVQLKGGQRVTAADVQTVVINANHSIFTLDRAKTIAAVQAAFPEFSKIDLKVTLPNTVVLTVSERKPILAWKDNDQIQWIAADGAVMPARGDGGTILTVHAGAAVPVVGAVSDQSASAAANTSAATPAVSTPVTASPESAPVGLQFIDPQILQAAISLSAQLPSGATLIYDPVAGIGWSDPKGWQVYFGSDLSNIAEKQVEYQAIVSRLTNLGIKPSLISVAQIDAPYFRTE